MTPRNVFPWLIAALIAVAVVLAVFSYSAIPGSVNTGLPSRFTANGRTFSITFTASTEPQREHGLMNSKITNTTIMLFAWPSAGTYSFWMYQTNSSLDIIWISANNGTGRIVYEALGAPPCYDSSSCPDYTPTSPANYALEVKAGFAEENGLQVGTILNFS
jgi:uncharacterized membrane protein (UPF0127 family)